MSFSSEEEPTGEQTKVFVSWSGTNSRINKVMPCGYAYSIPGREGEEMRWGSGGERDSMVLLNDVIERLVHLQFTSGQNEMKFLLVMNGTGAKIYFDEHTITWMQKKWRQSEKRRPAWTRAKLLSEVAGIKIIGPASKEERKLLETLRVFAHEKALEAEERKEHVSEGVKRRDDDSADEPNVA